MHLSAKNHNFEEIPMPATAEADGERTRVAEWIHKLSDLQRWSCTHNRDPLREKVVNAANDFWTVLMELCLFIDAFNTSPKRSLTGEKGVISKMNISKKQ